MRALPSKWVSARLDEVAEVNPRKNVMVTPDQLITFVPMAAVDEIEGAIKAPFDRPYGEVAKGFTHFQNDDVIFAKITPCMENGKSAIARSLRNNAGVGSTEFHVFRSSAAIVPEYLWQYVRQLSFREDAKAQMSGAVGQQRVPTDYLKSYEIPLPPLPEQKRIVDKVDSLTARTKRARAELDRIPTLIARSKQRLLSLAFSGELTADWRTSSTPDMQLPISGATSHKVSGRRSKGAGDNFTAPHELPESWRWLKIPELGMLDRGKSRHRPRNDPKLFGGSYPFIQTGDVRAAPRFLDTYTEAYSDFGLAQSRLWPVGTVCITIAANIAETAILSIEACFPDSVVGFLPDPSKISADYIEFFIRTMREELEAYAPATAQKNINLGVLSNVHVPTPPLKEQAEVVRRIEAAFKWLDRVSADHAAAAKLLPKLDAAILAKAFRGELVPQDPSDEPASALLERIVTNQPKSAPKARRKKA